MGKLYVSHGLKTNMDILEEEQKYLGIFYQIKRDFRYKNVHFYDM